MKYISLAIHNNEMVIVEDMRVFATHFCYSNKQKHGPVDIYVSPVAGEDDAEVPAVPFEAIDADMADEDDI